MSMLRGESLPILDMAVCHRHGHSWPWVGSMPQRPAANGERGGASFSKTHGEKTTSMATLVLRDMVKSGPMT